MRKLSIIVPTFNSDGSIEKCLSSIRSQIFSDYEVVIQDGGSTDATVDLIQDFQKANAGLDIKLHQERDHGIYDAMNKGMEHSVGQWLYFLGSDDELHDENVLSTLMKDSITQGCDVLYGNAKIIADTSWAEDNSVYDGIFNLEKFLKKNICHQAIFYRAEFIKQIGGYNQRYVVCADWDFNMRCWSRTEFKYVDLIVANFNAGGHSSNKPVDIHFSSEVTANVLKYFSLSVLDPLVNQPTFVGFNDIVKLRQSKNKFGHTVFRNFKGVARRLKNIATKCAIDP